MKLFNFFLGFYLIIGFQAKAAEITTYKTHTGQIFEKVANDRFGVAWKAPDGSVWSQYQGAFANSGALGKVTYENGDAVILSSAATEACARIGGTLPSLVQFQVLASYFGGDDVKADFEAIFPLPVLEPRFWTSNGLPSALGFMRYAIMPWDPYGDATDSNKQLSVMCRHD